MSLIARMVEAGTPADIIEEVAMLLAEKRLAEQAIAERRANDRARNDRRRAKNSSECHVTSRDDTCQSVTERDPPLSPPPNEKISNPPTHTPPDNNTRVREAKTKPLAKPDGVEPQTWADFLALRKQKRANVTKTVVDGIRREAVKAGWTLEAALQETVLRGWQSFKAEFVETKHSRGPPGDSGSYFETYRNKQAVGN